MRQYGWVLERKSIRGKGKGKSAAGRLNLVEKICHRRLINMYVGLFWLDFLTEKF
jgi:hypothetical protein